MKIKTLSDRVSTWSILPSAALHGKILELQNAGEKIIDLTIGISNLAIPHAGKRAAISAITNDTIPYTAVGGDSELKRAIQKKLKDQNKINCDLDTIIVSTGAKQVIFQALFALTNPGDKVVLIKPYWPAYTQMLSMLKLEPFTIDLDKLDSIKDRKTDPNTKILLFDLPHNPSGKVYSKKELLDLITFAKRNNLFIIADESYEKLIYEGQQNSLVTLDKTMKENIMTIFSVSQSFSMMGWRLGYATANKNIISAMEAVQSSITAATPYISQTAVTAIINNTSYSNDLVKKFKKRRDSIYAKLKDIDVITIELPESGPYFWCNIKKVTRNSLDFTEKLLQKEKIAVMPGEPFGTPGWIRIAFNVHEIPVLEDSISRLASFIKTYEK